MTDTSVIETQVLLSLGSNLGNKKNYINQALELLSSNAVINNLQVSSFYETEPVGYLEQDWFINIAVIGYTNLTSGELLSECKKIEGILGRKSHQQWHEREIDIDILLYGDTFFSKQILTIPHPRMHERRFVLVPAAEIACDVIHPIFKRTISQLLEDCHDNSIVKLCAIE